MTTFKGLCKAIEDEIRGRADSENIMPLWIGAGRQERAEWALLILRDEASVVEVVDSLARGTFPCLTEYTACGKIQA